MTTMGSANTKTNTGVVWHESFLGLEWLVTVLQNPLHNYTVWISSEEGSVVMGLFAVGLAGLSNASHIHGIYCSLV